MNEEPIIKKVIDSRSPNKNNIEDRKCPTHPGHEYTQYCQKSNTKLCPNCIERHCESCEESHVLIADLNKLRKSGSKEKNEGSTTEEDKENTTSKTIMAFRVDDSDVFCSATLTKKEDTFPPGNYNEVSHILLIDQGKLNIKFFNPHTKKVGFSEFPLIDEVFALVEFKSIMLDDSCFIFGGSIKKDADKRIGNDITENVLRVNIKKNEFIPYSKMNFKRHNHAVSLGKSDKEEVLYIAGGTSTTCSKKVEMFNFSNKNSKNLADLNHARHHFSLINFENKSLYAISGKNPAEFMKMQVTIEHLNLMDRSNPAWELVEVLNDWAGNYNHSACKISEKEILIFGGSYSVPTTPQLLTRKNNKKFEFTELESSKIKDSMMKFDSPPILVGDTVYSINTLERTLMMYFTKTQKWGSVPFDFIAAILEDN